MKRLRPVHFFFVALALLILVSVVATFLHSPSQSAETSSIEAAVNTVQKKLEVYRSMKGQYPESLDVLTFTNSPQEIPIQPLVDKMTYRRMESGYDLSCGPFRRTLSVPKNP